MATKRRRDKRHRQQKAPQKAPHSEAATDPPEQPTASEGEPEAIQGQSVPLLLTERQACDVVGISRATLHRFGRPGQVRLPGGGTKYRRDDLLQFVQGLPQVEGAKP